MSERKSTDESTEPERDESPKEPTGESDGTPTKDERTMFVVEDEELA